jgi:hypothetical protein
MAGDYEIEKRDENPYRDRGKMETESGIRWLIWEQGYKNKSGLKGNFKLNSK